MNNGSEPDNRKSINFHTKSMKGGMRKSAGDISGTTAGPSAVVWASTFIKETVFGPTEKTTMKNQQEGQL